MLEHHWEDIGLVEFSLDVAGDRATLIFSSLTTGTEAARLTFRNLLSVRFTSSFCFAAADLRGPIGEATLESFALDSVQNCLNACSSGFQVSAEVMTTLRASAYCRLSLEGGDLEGELFALSWGVHSTRVD